MNIAEINKLIKEKNFQKALIEYDTYMCQYPELVNSLYLSRGNAYKKLVNKLCAQVKIAMQYARAWTGPRDNNAIGINLLQNTVDRQDSKSFIKLQWWRLDFVIEGSSDKEKIFLPLSILKNSQNVINFNAEFNTSEMTSIFIAYPESIFMGELVQGCDYFDSTVIAFTMCRLNDDQIVEQIICRHLNKYDPNVDWRDFQTLITDPVASRLTISEYLYNDYFKYFDGVNRNDPVTRQYLFRVYIELNSIVSLYLKLQGITTIDFNSLDSVLNTVPYKVQLGNGIDFNIEGFKIITNIFILHGWIIDPSKNICSLRITHLECNEIFEFFPQIIKWERLDVIKHSGDASATIDTHFGFASASNVSLFFTKELMEGWTINCTTNEGKNYSEPLSLFQLPSNMEGLAAASNIVPSQTTRFDQCRYFFKPIFDAYRKTHQADSEGYHHTFDFKPSMHIPTLSIIIPLYGMTRFELTQIPVLAALHRSDWEVIFAVDDPSILEEVKGNIYRLSMLYGISISVVAPSVNLGFAGINNFAVKYARADVILFLNSDCFVTNKLAIEQGLEWIDSSPENGAAGFRLTYADRTIQHDGMSLVKWKNNPEFFLNDHPRQGFDENLIPSIINNDESILLTAACLMVKKSLFLEVNGFDCDYFKGDFEDSDLCLKIIAKNRTLGIIRQPGTYHLERQSISSIDTLLRERITMTNSFTYSTRWGEILNAKLPSLQVIL